MKSKGRSTDQALLRTALNKKLQTFSHKRLLKDLQEIENEKVPTVGVTARPLDNNLFIWHANIRGPQGTLYEGGVFHLQMSFPLSYPHHPPTITMFNKIPHPNVFDSYICLDMIKQNGQREEGQGWTSAYSVQSILTQLQSFLFEENLNENKQLVELQSKKAVKEANSFKCNACKHGGKLSCWPLFSSSENDKDEFKILAEQKQLIKKQLICYHTKLSYHDNQLGFGLNVTKIPRTGNIKEAQTFLDYISIKAYIKESINRTSNNQRITNWMPVYFGKGDNEQRFFKFFTKSLSMIMTNSTRNFKVEFILEVLPKIMTTIIFYIMDEKKHASIRYIRLLTHIHSIFLYSLKKFPQLIQSIKITLTRFIGDDEARTKENQANLGCILAMLSAVDCCKFADIVEAYFCEQLDRQVLWILKQIPELVDTKQQVDKERAKTVFKSQMTSFQMLCFYRVFIGEICQKRQNRALMLQEYEENLCKFTNKEEEEFQNKIFNIQRNIKSFPEFFRFVGLKERSEEQIIEMLKRAIKNSERKKYHGEFQTIHELPNSQDQFSKILSKIPNFKTYFKISQIESQGNEIKQIAYQIKEEQSSEDDWRKMCIQRWSWIKEATIYQKHLTSQQISAKAIEFTKNGILKEQERLMKIIREKYKSCGIDYNLPKITFPSISWKQLFLRLDLEDFLMYIDMNPDFNSFYEKLQVCKFAEVNTLLIPLVPINKIKSGYFYLTSLLSKLNSLKYVELTGLPQKNRINDKLAKAIKKGFNNFLSNKGELVILSFHNIVVDKDYSESLLQYLINSNNLVSLRLSHTNLLLFGNSMKVLNKSLSQLKDLQELIFNQCQLNEEKCKSVADVLMRAKKLRIFTVHNKQNMNNGLSSLIYNLSFFSPNLQMLDISKCQSNVAETIVSLYKLLKITTSMEVLLANNVRNLNPSLIDQFWISLGECKSLRVLDLSYSGDISPKVVNLGNSIAFNAKKKGALEYIDLTGNINNAVSLNNLYSGMCISEYDEEKIYGDASKAQKMISSNYVKQYFNNLKALQLNLCGNLNPNFNLAYWNRLKHKEDPELAKILARSINLVNVCLSNNGLNKNFAEILSLSIDTRRKNFVSKIKVLDLSKNNFGKDGIKALAQVLPHNQIIQVLDLSKNNLGVPGAKALAVALKENKSLRFLNLFNNNIGYDGAKSLAQHVIQNHPKLECLQIGHNRIRDKGLRKVVDALVLNKNSEIKILGLRFNYITNNGATYFYNKLTATKLKIEQIFLANNLIDDVAINNLDQIKEHLGSNIAIDLLQKLKYLDPERLERTVWIHPIENINLQNLKDFFEITHKCGIVIDARVKRGKVYPNKHGDNLFGFIEFADSISVNRALHIASKKLTIVDGIKFRIYKAGTGTFHFTKKTSKQKKLQQATPYDMIITRSARLPVPERGARRVRGFERFNPHQMVPQTLYRGFGRPKINGPILGQPFGMSHYPMMPTGVMRLPPSMQIPQYPGMGVQPPLIRNRIPPMGMGIPPPMVTNHPIMPTGTAMGNPPMRPPRQSQIRRPRPTRPPTIGYGKRQQFNNRRGGQDLQSMRHRGIERGEGRRDERRQPVDGGERRRYGDRNVRRYDQGSQRRERPDRDRYDRDRYDRDRFDRRDDRGPQRRQPADGGERRRQDRRDYKRPQRRVRPDRDERTYDRDDGGSQRRQRGDRENRGEQERGEEW